MNSLEADLKRARRLSVEQLADAIESIGFECTHCGACCRGHGEDEHTATVFPDEVRTLQRQESTTEYDWRDVARPMPYGLTEGANGLEGETFEWALKTTDCGDCVFYDPANTAGDGACRVHANRPLICQTYPFSVALSSTSQPMGEPVDKAGIVRAHECEGLGRDIARADAEALAETLKERAIRELEEALAVLDAYEPVHERSKASPEASVIVHDSEGAKRPDGKPLEETETQRSHERTPR